MSAPHELAVAVAELLEELDLPPEARVGVAALRCGEAAGRPSVEASHSPECARITRCRIEVTAAPFTKDATAPARRFRDDQDMILRTCVGA